MEKVVKLLYLRNEAKENLVEMKKMQNEGYLNIFSFDIKNFNLSDSPSEAELLTVEYIVNKLVSYNPDFIYRAGEMIEVNKETIKSDILWSIYLERNQNINSGKER